MAKVKGIFFTLGFLFLLLALITLSLLLISTLHSSNERLSEVGSLDRVYSLHFSIQSSLRDIFNNNSGINIFSNGSQISFEETLPNGLSNLNMSMLNFKDFVESNHLNVEINVSRALDPLTLIIKPQGITYQHNTPNEIKIIPETINFIGYSFIISAPYEVSCSSNLVSGDTSFSIRVLGTNTNCSESALIDPSSSNSFIINDGGISITIENPGILTLTNNLAQANIRNTILLNETDELVTVHYPEGIIKIDFRDIDIYKRGTSRIY